MKTVEGSQLVVFRLPEALVFFVDKTTKWSFPKRVIAIEASLRNLKGVQKLSRLKREGERQIERELLVTRMVIICSLIG
jgi:hypothetical protein